MSIYKTRPCTKAEIAEINKVPKPFLGHSITGLDAKFKSIIETMRESHASGIEAVVYLRIRQLNGRYIYRHIESR